MDTDDAIWKNSLISFSSPNAAVLCFVCQTLSKKSQTQIKTKTNNKMKKVK